MADLVGLFSQGINVKIGGKDYICRPLKLKDFSDLSMRVKALRHNEVKELISILPDSKDRTDMIKSSLRPVKDQDVFDYIATFDGILFMFWLLVKNESEFKTFDEFQSIVSIDDIKAVQEVITSAMGAENFQKAQAIAVEKGYRGQQLAPDSANIMDGI